MAFVGMMPHAGWDNSVITRRIRSNWKGIKDFITTFDDENEIPRRDWAQMKGEETTELFQ